MKSIQVESTFNRIIVKFALNEIKIRVRKPAKEPCVRGALND
jgi:hypothetical protein